MKMAIQYFMEMSQPQPQRVNFISRKSSYHGNTLGSLAVGHHVARRAIYEKTLATNVHHVSQCYPYRDMLPTDTVESYVARLAQELENMFQSLGPDTVCAFVAETMAGAVSHYPTIQGPSTLTTTDSGLCPSPSRLPQSHERSLRAPRSPIHPRRGNVRNGKNRHSPRLGAGRRRARPPDNRQRPWRRLCPHRSPTRQPVCGGHLDQRHRCIRPQPDLPGSSGCMRGCLSGAADYPV